MRKLTRIGKFNEFDAPPKAEHYLFSGFVQRTVKKVASKFVPDLRKDVVTLTFHCPCCFLSYDCEEMMHGDSYRCACGLKFQTLGSSLLLWR